MNYDWTWSGAGEEALYGIISIFFILILLTLLTCVAGKVVPWIDKGPYTNDGRKLH